MFATRWAPLNLSNADWRRLQGEMERAFEQLTGTTFQHLAGYGFPPLNMWEEEERFVVEAELPGLSLSDLEISLSTDNELTIKGERTRPEWENGTWHRRERGTGRFTRTLQLPQAVDADHVEAEFKQGVLTISLPKRPEVKPRRIEVKAG